MSQKPQFLIGVEHLRGLARIIINADNSATHANLIIYAKNDRRYIVTLEKTARQS